MLLSNIRLFLVIALAVFSSSVNAQNTATNAETRDASWLKHQSERKNSVFLRYDFTNIGPSIMSGRVVDLAVNPAKPEEYLAAFASGGLWHTQDNGLEFSPIFDKEQSITIGDIAVDWSKRTFWIGTGENNSSRSSYAGSGLYKSTDEGKTWHKSGLNDAQHIGRILLHPTQSQTLWVAVLGHLYSNNHERGVFKSTDGGQTWQKTLYINDSTGVIDLVQDPQNPDLLYAAAWERSRAAWNFKGQGAGSGIYKSSDGGLTWQKMSIGLPQNDKVGRIGLAVSAKTPNLVFAVMDNQNSRPERDKKNSKLDLAKQIKSKLGSISNEDFLKIPEKDLEVFLQVYKFPKDYTLKSVLIKVKNKSLIPKDLLQYTSNANTNLFETEVIGAEVYMSSDAGLTWKKTHKDFIDDFFYTYGYYFGQIIVSPQDDRKLYILGVPILKSDDGGKSWASISGDNVHLDMHALWINPKNPQHLLLGNDGGLNLSYNDGRSWQKINNLPVGQFYSIAVDNAEPYNVYGGLQDNGVWYAPHTYKTSRDWQSTGTYPYKFLLGGDGMQVQIDPRNHNTVYAGSQFGYYYRLDKTTGESVPITPRNIVGMPALRYNWQTPIHLSVHQPDVLYLGSQYVHRSLNQGKNWTKISADLTKGESAGNVPYGTITALHESPLKFGLLYAGSDDGLIHGSQDGGYTWTPLHNTLPKGLWVSSVEASQHQEGRVWLTLSGYRQDHFEPYLYRSDDFGKNWQRLGQNLPQEPINVVLEDPNHSKICYVGTDNGLYVSLDSGLTFQTFGDLPRVAVHDLVVQQEKKHLLVGTHGRSIYRTDLQLLYEFLVKEQGKKLFVRKPENRTFSEDWGQNWSRWFPSAQPELLLSGYNPTSGEAVLEVVSEQKQVVFLEKKGLEKGFFDWRYNMKTPENEAIEGTYLQKGTYTIRLTVGGQKTEHIWKLE